MTDESVKTITEFLKDILPWIVLLVICITQRKSINSIFTRLINFSFKNGDTEVAIHAVEPIENKKEVHIPIPKQSSEDVEDKESTIKKEVLTEEEHLTGSYKALSEGKIEEARLAFEKYATLEKDPLKFSEKKAIYLYFLFESTNDHDIFNQYDRLIESIENEESKYRILEWYSFCFRHISKFDLDVNLWQNSIKKFSKDLYITKSTVNLALSLNKLGDSIKAKDLLIQKLQDASLNEEKYAIYNALSSIEGKIGNKSLELYCKDKAIEFTTNTKSDLFDVAYLASENKYNSLAISNYDSLLKIDTKNANALNNFGVQAQNENFNIIAIENYKKSSENNNTLSMANQGYLLLDAGFIKEAQEIAQEALKKEEVHENIYSLLSAISEKKKEQEKKWHELINNSKNEQQFIRKYVEAYYTNNKHSFNGKWKLSSNKTIDIEVIDNKIDVKWEEIKGGLSNSEIYLTKLLGFVHKSSLKGRYSQSKKDKSTVSSLLALSLDINVEFIGVISNNGYTIELISDNSKEKFNLILTRVS